MKGGEEKDVVKVEGKKIQRGKGMLKWYVMLPCYNNYKLKGNTNLSYKKLKTHRRKRNS
jgi:hypothetical protein